MLKFSRIHIKQVKYLIMKSLLFGICTGIVFALYLGINSVDIESLLIQVLGGFAVNEAGFSLSIIFYFTPFFTQLLLMGNIMRDDFNTASSYIFTRTRKRSDWYYSKVFHIFLCSALYWLSMLSSIIMTGYIVKTPISSANTLFLSVYSLLSTVALLYTMYVIIMNVFSLRFSSTTSLFCIVIMFIISVYIINDIAVSNGWIAFVIPSTQGMLAAHDIPQLAVLCPDFFSGKIKGLTPFFSMILNFTYIGITLYLGMRLLYRNNI